MSMYKNLRNRENMSYFEPKEPAADQYVFCDKCADFVYEYCSIHGPLLVIPDDQIPQKRDFPSLVPRAALTIPKVFLHIAPSVIPVCDKCADFVYEYCSIHGPLLVIPDDQIPQKRDFPSLVPRAALTIPKVFLHIAPSVIPGAGLGVFTTLTLPRGVRFGPYRGQISKDTKSLYCWQIYDGNNKRSHVVDAEDCNKSNWMRYVNCSRHWREQNLVAYQYQGQLYYRTIKIIPRFTELLIFYGSEFANILNIDLRMYNSKEHHLTNGPNKIEEETITAESEKHENNINVVTDIIDDFLYDEETNADTQLYENSYFNVNSDSKSPISVRYDRDNECFKVEYNDTLNIKEQADKNNDNIFQCNQCDFKTKHRKNLKRHALSLHSQFQNTFECNVCSYKTHMKTYMNRHSRIHITARCYKCQRCKDDFQTKSVFDEHKEKCETKKHKCSECSYECKRPCKLREHMQRHTKDTIYKCDLCTYFGYVKRDLLSHKRSVHKVKQLSTDNSFD